MAARISDFGPERTVGHRCAGLERESKADPDKIQSPVASFALWPAPDYEANLTSRLERVFIYVLTVQRLR